MATGAWLRQSGQRERQASTGQRVRPIAEGGAWTAPLIASVPRHAAATAPEEVGRRSGRAVGQALLESRSLALSAGRALYSKPYSALHLHRALDGSLLMAANRLSITDIIEGIAETLADSIGAGVGRHLGNR